MHASSMIQTQLSILPTVKSAIGGTRPAPVNAEEDDDSEPALGESYVETCLALLTVWLSVLTVTC